jgi:hypothetical protein
MLPTGCGVAAAPWLAEAEGDGGWLAEAGGEGAWLADGVWKRMVPARSNPGIRMPV